MMPHLLENFLNLNDFDLQMKHVLLPDAGQRSLPFFLAMEEYVARKYDGEAFFVWRVEPTVIIGRNQVLENEVNLEYCRERGVEVVRRFWKRRRDLTFAVYTAIL